MYHFTEDCKTGIAEIDAEHEYLFQMIDQTNELLSTNADVREVGQDFLIRLKEYAKTHFKHEESYMEKIQDPELPRQRKAHAAFSDRVNSFDMTSMDEATLRTSLIELLEYMSRWLFQHILGSDIYIGQSESPFTFTDKYLTGIDLIDKEHRQLFLIIGEANELIHDELLFDKYDKIVDIINNLREYTEFHFADEEVYMETLQYPDLPQQKKAHQSFVDKLNEIDLDEVDEKQQEYLNNLISFLLSWLTMHILKMDKKIGDYVKSQKK